ncbi:unnamed protein product [Mesocestoides corti]|uniref:G patch domain-containing protein 11 n=1 Tax=Mesocestoides corti TaxID=53468 RepID=A0A0R3U3R9_MESCO|nr:unnamed protein product [Mesocestoides corti]
MGEKSDSDDDYMSDKFLNPPDAPSRSDLLLNNKKHHKSVENPQRFQGVTKGKQMVVKREEGLKRRIGEDNVGFKIMKKMGFTGEGGIGKNSEGRSEPVPISVIDGRKGLGLHNIKEKRDEAFAAARQQRDLKISAFQSDFRASMASRFYMERVQRQLTAARSICKQLDLAQSLEQPVDKAFWPPDDLTAKLLAQSKVIRREICRSEPRRSCAKKPKHLTVPPNKTEDSPESLDAPLGEYDSVLGIESDEEYYDVDAAQHGPIESEASVESPDVILARLSVYLRESHSYCFWCGEHYSNNSDLMTNCPGPLEEDHG